MVTISGPSSTARRVVIAGGGIAGIEAMLALRALSADVRIDLVSADRRFVYRPGATADPFAEAPALTRDLAVVAADADAALRVDRLEAVAPAKRLARLGSGALVSYDALILATGTRRLAVVAGALTFTGPSDTPHVKAILRDIDAGAVRRVLFCVPGGVTWPLGVYELALLTAGYARDRGRECQVGVVTPEREPLEVFGSYGSQLVAGVLKEHGVRFLGARTPERFERDGQLRIRGAGALPADRVVAAASLVGRPIPGIPAGWNGFVPVDGRGRVDGVGGVWAAGDMTSYPVKHGGLGTQLADVIASDVLAEEILTGLGDRPAGPPRPAVRVLRTRLIGGREAIELYAVLDEHGRAIDARLDSACGPADRPGDPLSKVYGRHLTPYLTATATAAAAS